MPVKKYPPIRVGDRFGTRTVVGEPFRVKINVQARTVVVCECDCGSVDVVDTGNLKQGQARSCGCVGRGGAVTTHGLTGTPLYHCWQTMHRRGGVVFVEWHNVVPFVKWARGGWKPGLCLDRIDRTAPFSPSNCRFATRRITLRRSNVLRLAFGEEKTLWDWARDKRCVVKRGTLERRINLLHWDLERAITTPAQVQKRSC